MLLYVILDDDVLVLRWSSIFNALLLYVILDDDVLILRRSGIFNALLLYVILDNDVLALRRADNFDRAGLFIYSRDNFGIAFLSNLHGLGGETAVHRRILSRAGDCAVLNRPVI